MMNARQVVALLAVLLLLGVVLIRPSSGQTGIIVNNADAQREVSISLSKDLANSTAGVGPRVAVQYANSIRHISLPAVPGSLQTLLGQVPSRIIFQYANTNREERLSAVPAALQTLLGQVADRIIFQYANTNRELSLSVMPGSLQTLLAQVPDRIIFQYANTNRQMGLGYPLTLISDTTPPQISGVMARAAHGGEVIAWTTNEYATSIVRYGRQPGVYPQTFNDPFYAKQHEVTLTGVTPGVTYYFVVRSIDRSSNAAESAESHFTTTISTYLPVILRRR
jgi:hypothetical protein